ncbi:MAG: helix-turn-helix transcriptional regulator [Promethearchaeota archaeon]
MPSKRDIRLLTDILLFMLAIIVLGIAGWTWIVVVPVAHEIVFIAITFALIASLILMLSAVVLVVLSLRSRVKRLEHLVDQTATSPEPVSQAPVQVVTLSNVERRILNRLEEEGGALTQEKLRRVTGLSKSTLSVALGDLERKSLITRKDYGRTKIVNLVRKIRR